MNDEEVLAVLAENPDGPGKAHARDRKNNPQYSSFLIVKESTTKAALEKALKTNISRGVCHREVLNGSTNMTHVITFLNDQLLYREGAITFYDYLMNRSVFAPAFTSKDAKAALATGTVVNPNVQGGLMLGALQLSRLTTGEYTNSFNTTCRVLEMDVGKRVNPLLLFWILVQVGGTVSEEGILLGYRRLGGDFIKLNHLPFPGKSPYSQGDRGCVGLKTLRNVLDDGRLSPEAIQSGTFKHSGTWSRPESCTIFELPETERFSSLTDGLFSGEPFSFNGAGLAEKVLLPWTELANKFAARGVSSSRSAEAVSLAPLFQLQEKEGYSL